MKSKALKMKEGFRVAFTTKAAQIAEMVIAPDGAEGDSENDHRASDQWLFVLSGTGVAIVDGKKIILRRGMLLLIERKEKHQIKNTGRSLLKTLNIYTPPAYTKSGHERQQGRRSKH